MYNGDLTGRVIPINADQWRNDELRSVIHQGEQLLQVSFENDFIDHLVKDCFDSVAIVQECCRRACRSAGVYVTQQNKVPISYESDVRSLIREVVNEQRGRYQAFLSNFADGFQDTRLEMHRWLLWPILTSEPRQLEQGLTYSEIRRSLQHKHPSGSALNPGNITQALQSAASLQVDKDIKPIILDYDATTRRLSIVDRGFLVWLASQDKQEVLEMAGLPAYTN